METSSSRARPAALLSFRGVERPLVIVGLALLAGYGLLTLWSWWYQATSMRELERLRASFSETPAAGAPTPGRVRPAPGSIVGRIDVDRVELSAIIREGDDVATLRSAVGHLPDTALPGDRGNAALAGHRDTFFRALKHVRTGDRIVVTTPSAAFRYVVLDTRVVEPTDISVLEATPGSTLTLVTCYPFGYIGAAPKRFIVRAEMAAVP